MAEPSLKFDTPEWRDERNRRLLGWMNGNENAVRVVLALGDACEMWDDLVDGDSPVSTDDINRVFTGIFVGLTTNPFWQAGRGFLEPIIVVAVNAWMDANELAERDNKRLRQLAFHIRNYSTELAIACAFLAGGWQHLRAVSTEMREFFQHESYADWELRK